MKKLISVLFALGLVAQIGLFSAFAAPKVAVASIKVTPASITLAAANTGIIKATVLPATATNKAVSWKSSNTTVAIIDSKGKVTALSIGSATITCTAKDGSGKKAVSKVTVIKPTTKAQILAAYTTVMNKAKTAKPAYKSYEYQALPEKERNIGGAVKYLLPLAEIFMTKEEKAKAEPGTFEKGNNMSAFLVKNSSKGCLLTNANAIKTATFAKLANGNYKITIILNDEINPEPYKIGQTKVSNVGSMFSPLGKNDVDNVLKNDSTVKRIIKSSDYSLKYRNCKAVLEYNPKTNQIVALDQYTNTFLTMSGKIIILGTSSGTAVLEMFYKAYSFKY